MKTGIWVKTLISGVVGSIALCAVLLFVGCTSGVVKGDQCEDGQERALAVLTGLLTTVMGLAIKLDALEEPKPPTRRVTPSK